MSPQRFEHLLSLVGPHIQRKCTQLRGSISAAERLTLTLRYLASGDAQQSQSFNSTIGKSTVSGIIKETCQAIWAALRNTYVKTPNSPEAWKSISKDFEKMWNFPHCLGAGDGKHVVIECPPHSGSEFFNYKGTFSMLLLAYGDANYCFTAVDVGQYGKSNDSGAYTDSAICKAFETNSFNIPTSEYLEGVGRNVPYVTVVDEGLPMRKYQIRPFPGKHLDENQTIYNYRLSRARRIIENIFGILAARWRIFRRPIKASTDTVEKIILSTVSLHNYLRLTDNSYYSPSGFIDSEDNTGHIRPGDWREMVSSDLGALQPLQPRSGRTSYDANEIRNTFKEYFVSAEGQVSWQWDHVRNVGPRT